MKAMMWVHLVAAATIVAALATWFATGSEGYTRWPNERLARSDAPPVAGESDLLAEAGFSEAMGASSTPDIESRFALGLVPGGTDPRHLISVATIVACSLVASGAAIVIRVRGRTRSLAEGEHR